MQLLPVVPTEKDLAETVAIEAGDWDTLTGLELRWYLRFYEKSSELNPRAPERWIDENEAFEVFTEEINQAQADRQAALREQQAEGSQRNATRSSLVLLSHRYYPGGRSSERTALRDLHRAASR